MKILHACLAGEGVTDGWSYQDNLLTKWHRRLGYEVVIVAPQWQYNDEGIFVKTPCGSYLNENDCVIHRLRIRGGLRSSSRLKTYVGLMQILEHEKPEIIFVHGCQCLDILNIVRYAKQHPEITIYVDHHADFSNSASNWVSKNILHKIFWKHCAKAIEPYTTKFYGVLPARVDFLINMYGIPKSKSELLVMGADDEMVAAAKSSEVRKSIREKYGISEDDFLIMTGGKIDKNKPQTLLLMEAMQGLKTDKVKLIVFGSVSSEYTESFHALLDNNTIYAGWVQPAETYKYFNAADLVVFPGLHSVFWEQVVGLGKPCLFKYIKGFTHVDLGGNCDFLYEDSVDEIQNKIQSIIDNPAKFEQMQRVAEKMGMDTFSYRSIADKSIK